MPNENTVKQYKNSAKGFYQKYLADTPQTPHNVTQALIKAANDRPKNAWSTLCTQVRFDQFQKGRQDVVDCLKKLQHPSKHDSSFRSPDGPDRSKQVTESQHQSLLEELVSCKDRGVRGIEAVFAAVTLAQILGCRPNEMPGVRVESDNRVYIPGSKFRSAGDRGLNRYVTISDENELNYVRSCVKKLAQEPHHKNGPMPAIQQRLKRICKRVSCHDPASTESPRPSLNLYAYRHQMSSDFKFEYNSSIRNNETPRLSREQIAYIMGHQSTASLDPYGRPRYGRSGCRKLSPGVNEEDVAAVVKTKHSFHPNSPEGRKLNEGLRNDSNQQDPLVASNSKDMKM